MEYLFDQFGPLHGYFIATFTIFLRYALFAGIAFGIFYIIRKQNWQRLKIQQKFPKAKYIFNEIQHSLFTAFIFALMGVGLYYCRQAGLSQIYTDISTYGWAYLIFSFVALMFIHDTYFYWVHRLMHHRKLFRLMHRVHHQSFNPTPWASLSFHPLEAIAEVAILPIAAFFLPIHPITLALFATWSLVWNIVGHLGYEVFPKGFVYHPFFRWFNTSTHHNMHHEISNCNYGLYFNIWDTWMGTNHEDYRKRFDEIVNKREAEGGTRHDALTTLNS